MQINFQNDNKSNFVVKPENSNELSNNEVHNFNNAFESKSYYYSKNALSFSVQSILSSPMTNEHSMITREQDAKMKNLEIISKSLSNHQLAHSVNSVSKEPVTNLTYPNITLVSMGYKVNFLQSPLTNNSSVLSPIIPRFIDHSNKASMIGHQYNADGTGLMTGNLWRNHTVLPTGKFSMFGSIIQNPISALSHNFTGLQAFLSNLQFRNRPRRSMLKRSVFSDGQRQGLEDSFKTHAYITKPDRKELADKLGLKDAQVKIWFQNRRMKWRNSKDRDISVSESDKKTVPIKDNKDSSLMIVNEKSPGFRINENETDCLKANNIVDHVENCNHIEPTDFSLKSEKLSLDYLIH